MTPLPFRLENEIVVPWLPHGLGQEVKRQLTFENPEYKEAKTFGRSVRGVAQYIRFYQSVGNAYRLPRGFLRDFMQLLHREDYTPVIEDLTPSFTRQTFRDDIELRPYQLGWVDDLLSETQGIGVAPPGAGKTICGLELYARIGQPCLWLTHTKGLARQVAKRLKSFMGEEAGFIGDGKEELRHFTVGLVPTLVRRDLSEIVKLFGLIIVDEAHHAPAHTFDRVISQFWARYRYGLTATPYREDGLEPLMFHSIGPTMAQITRPELRALGALVTPTVHRRTTKFWFPYNSKVKEANYKALEEALMYDDARNDLIMQDVSLEAMAESNTCIVLVSRIEHGEILRERISKIHDGVGLTHSKMSPKKAYQVIDDFSEGKVRILIATYKMLAEGFDYPPANRLFLVGPHRGRTLIEQASGRVERPWPLKLDALIYDYVDPNVLPLLNQAEARLDVFYANDIPVVNLN